MKKGIGKTNDRSKIVFTLMAKSEANMHVQRCQDVGNAKSE